MVGQKKIAGTGTETGVMRTECDIYAAGCAALSWRDTGTGNIGYHG